MLDLDYWIPSITTTSLLAVVVWLGRKVFETRLTRSVAHEFDRKLEVVRAEFRERELSLKADLESKEAEISALRNGTLTAMSSRQMSLDKRRLEAVDELWSAVNVLAKAKFVLLFMAPLKFDEARAEAERNPQFRKIFETVGAGVDIAKMDLSGSHKARPFVSPMAWALFAAYQAIIMLGLGKLTVLKAGVAKGDFFDHAAVATLLKVALPHHAPYVDAVGDGGYHFLLAELEERLLAEFRNFLAGIENDKQSLEQAAQILKLSTELQNTTRVAQES